MTDEYKTYKVKVVRVERRLITALVHRSNEEEAREYAEDGCWDLELENAFSNFEAHEILSIEEVADAED
jgi:hypothetical protein